MTLYQRIVAQLSGAPMTAIQLTAALGSPYLSVQSAVRDLKRYGFVVATGLDGRSAIYTTTEKAEGFTHIQGRPQRGVRKPESTVERAQRTVAKSAFEWRASL